MRGEDRRMNSRTDLSRRDKLLVLAAAVPFLASIGLLGFAFNTGALIAFASFWPLFQVAGYVWTLRMAKGALDHPLVKTQIVLHWMMLCIVAALFARAT